MLGVPRPRGAITPRLRRQRGDSGAWQGWLLAWTPAELHGTGTPGQRQQLPKPGCWEGAGRRGQAGARAPALPGSKRFGKEAAAFSQGFGKEFQKVLGVVSLFLEQMKSWALLRSAILSLRFAKFPSRATGAELSRAELS